MKKVSVAKSSEVKVKAFKLSDFIQPKETSATIEKITKKELKKIADGLGLNYDDMQIQFTKKMLIAYMEKIGKRD